MAFLFQAHQIVIEGGFSYNGARWNQFRKDKPKVWVRIEEEKPRRSINQNSFYWLYLAQIEKETGNEAQDLHTLFRQKLLPPKIIVVKGRAYETPKSTTDLNKLEFGEYIEKICAMTGVQIPDSEKYLKFYETAPLNQ